MDFVSVGGVYLNFKIQLVAQICICLVGIWTNANNWTRANNGYIVPFTRLVPGAMGALASLEASFLNSSLF